jgi:multimeric flavodoxin WrbA
MTGGLPSTATQHGGQEVTLFSIITNLMHFGMTIVGLPYSYQGQSAINEATTADTGRPFCCNRTCTKTTVTASPRRVWLIWTMSMVTISAGLRPCE